MEGLLQAGSSYFYYKFCFAGQSDAMKILNWNGRGMGKSWAANRIRNKLKSNSTPDFVSY
ncbi:hypothetical protein V6Z11_A12G161300 [Gossypium hirsutum]